MLLVKFFFLFLLPQNVVPESQRSPDTVSVVIAAKIAPSTDSITFKIVGADTSITGIQSFLWRNNYLLPLGNTGLPYYELFPFQNLAEKAGFQYGFNRYPQYNAPPLSFILKRKVLSYTDVSLALGSKKEQIVNLIHCQRFSEGIRAGLHVKKIRAEGFFNNQNVNLSSANIFVDFNSLRKTYYSKVSYSFTNHTYQENGGLISPEALIENTFADKRIFGVNLQAAIAKRKENELTLEQRIMLTKDSTVRDIFIGHRGSLANFNYIYTDRFPGQGFYKFVNDTVLTRDSTRFQTISNSLFLGVSKELHFEFSAGIEMEQIQRKFPALDIRDNISSFVNLNKTFSGLFIQSSYRYYLNGYNKSDFHFYNELRKDLIDSLISVTLNANVSKRTPGFFFQNYQSNHFNWNNNFKQVSTVNFATSFNLPANSKVGFSYYSINNYLYFNSSAIPTQKGENISYILIEGEKLFKLRKFNSLINLSYQKASSSIVRMPELVFNTSNFYQTRWFKNALVTQMGFDVFYFSSFNSYTYMPALSVFYLQHQERVGAYPIVDLFLNFKIKNRAKIFVKVEHANFGFTGSNYFISTNYPIVPRTLRLGFNWNFIN